MANEQIMPPQQAPAPAPASAPASAEAGGLPNELQAMEENPLDKIGSGNPMTKRIKSQLFGIEKSRARSEEMNAINKRSIDELREVVLDEFQTFLEENGVDINNPESVKAFIEAVGSINPDIVVLLETIFNSLQAEDPEVDVGKLSESRDLKKKFNDMKAKTAEPEMEESMEGVGSEAEETPPMETPPMETPPMETPPMETPPM